MPGPVPTLDRIATRAGDAARGWSISAKLIAALTIVLAPLLIFAVLAAFRNFHDYQLTRTQTSVARLTAIDRAIDASLAADFAMLETILLTGTGNADEDCNDLNVAATYDRHIESVERYDRQGRPMCIPSASPMPTAVTAQLDRLKRQQGPGMIRAVTIDTTGPTPSLWLLTRNNDNGTAAVASLPITALKPLVSDRMRGLGNWFTLKQGGRSLLDWRPGEPCDPLANCDVTPHLLSTAGLTLELRQPRQMMSAVQALSIGGPLLIWIAALLTAWLAAQRLMVKPVLKVRDAFVGYTQGDTTRRLSGERFLSREMTDLGEAFDRMADTIGRGEHDLRDALAEQKRLTREVHHRVKNNLQIVSSLLSIQAREAPSEDVALAYATVQARVGALALVHRWMYDDETANGVDLRALTTDLCASLEQALTATHKLAVTMHCNVERAIVSQDTAVPVAFLITELAGMATRLAPDGPVKVDVSAVTQGGIVRLGIASDAFKGGEPLTAGKDPAARIIAGMARQMRAQLRHDAQEGCYSIDIALPAAT